MKILILASNPRKDLNLDDEIRILQDAIDWSRNRDQFQVEKEVGVQVGDLQRLVLRHKPQIIHFCGHGSGQEGLIFKVDGGGEQRVQAAALAGLFELCPFIECVLLNACYSGEQAGAIAQHTDYVIGMSHAIQDNAAIAFSKGFYTALGYGESIESSFRFGVSAIHLEVSGSSIKRSSTTSVEERKAEIAGIVEATELKEHEKPRIFIKGREQTATDLAQLLSNEAIGARGADLLVKIDASLGNTVEEPKLQTFSFQMATVKVVVKPVRKTIEKQGFFGKRTEYIDATETGCNVIYQDGRAEFFEEKLDAHTVLEMVKIKGGNFTMGSPSSEKERLDDEGPQHLVRIQPFFMGKYAITQAQWFAVAQDFPKAKIDLKPDPSVFKGSNRPVESVDWWEAVEFCERLSQKTGKTYRLPSEAEWEYACRAGTETPFHFGETITPSLANYHGKHTYGAGAKGTFRQETTPVGSFNVANAFGLYDMHGNVWEWCADHWHNNYEGTPRDGSAWITGGNSDLRLLRGGSWGDDPWYCRSAYRLEYIPHGWTNYYGFRVVYSAARTPS